MENSNSRQEVTLSQSLTNLLRLMQEGLIVLDSSGCIIDAYEAAGKLFGFRDHSELVGKHFSELY
jgi:PAS domain-containing protein